jgi:myo-inositol-1(or 4)-monophosphatase
MSATPSPVSEEPRPVPDLRLSVACAVAREAGALARRRFVSRPGTTGINLKGSQDYLSALDAEVERLCRERLLAAFPDDTFYGEESGGTFGDSVWVVDPIDGTANFVRGIEEFCISIAYVRDGQMQVGALYDPMNDELFSAERGKGAWLNGERIQVSGIENMRSATVEAGWSTRLPMSDYVTMLSGIFEAGAGIRRGGSGAMALAYVAAGRLDAYCELHINSWDCLAGLLLIQEAGGWTNNFLTGDALSKGNPVLGCTPGLADELQRITGIRRLPSEH